MAADQRSTRKCYVNPTGRKRGLAGLGRAQAAIEFALIAPLVAMLLVVGVQFAIIGAAALGLGQANYQAARYAAVNPSASKSAVQSFMISAASPLIAANNGPYLTTNMSPAPPCNFGSTVTVSVTFDLAHLVMLPNPFLGVIKFPTTLNSSESALCE